MPRRFAFLNIFILLLAHAAHAATLSGRVVDPDGRAVAGARVIVTTTIGAAADRLTDAAGAFSIDRLPAGRYDVTVTAEGFHAAPATVTLAADESRTIDVPLRLSAITESIVV